MTRLPRPLNDVIDSDIWVDEDIWGHRLYDEQTPWLTFLEFLGIVQTETTEGRGFIEKDHNTLKYNTYHRLYLRNILFNNPHLDAILAEPLDNDNQWKKWLEYIKDNCGGIDSPDFSYLAERFSSFRDFAEAVKFLQRSSIEGDSNKRWSSKFVFPYGPHCLYEDLRVTNTGASNDRRFFARTGELLYLMFCRAEKGQDVLYYLKKLGLVSSKEFGKFHLSKWDRLVATLQPNLGEEKPPDRGGKRTSPYLPHSSLPEYDNLAEDWIRILQCDMPDYDAIPHLVTITGLHIIIYLLNRAKETLKQPTHPTFILEVIASEKTVVRDLAATSFLENNNLSKEAVKKYIRAIENTSAWKECETAHDPLDSAFNLLEETFAWSKPKEDAVRVSSLDKLLEDLCDRATTRHESHLGKFHRTWSKEIGLSSSRASRRIRYAPTDSLLKTLVLCTVPYRMEFQEFLAELYKKYGFIIGDRQAIETINTGAVDQEAFSENAHRLEQRLISVGLLKRLSDACAYVQNPFAVEDFR